MPRSIQANKAAASAGPPSHRPSAWEMCRDRCSPVKWAEFFETYDALLCPVTAVPAFPHDTDRRVPDRRISVNGEERPYMELLRWAGLATVSHLPASAAPTGRSKDGLPLGVQIVGPYQEDLTCLAAARLLEQSFGGFRAPPLS